MAAVRDEPVMAVLAGAAGAATFYALGRLVGGRDWHRDRRYRAMTFFGCFVLLLVGLVSRWGFLFLPAVALLVLAAVVAHRGWLRVLGERRGMMVFVGPWAARFSWRSAGRFGNGSRWCSGWHRWEYPNHWEGPND